jgi:inner membrane protein
MPESYNTFCGTFQKMGCSAIPEIIIEHKVAWSRRNCRQKSLYCIFFKGSYVDPISQAVLGASASQSVASRGDMARASLLGALAGMSADLDVLIRSSTDPLLFLMYHRQFTHSLLFIPIGALICALILYYITKKRGGLTFGLTYLFCLLGYATHALLDACTTYGTQLLWPFSDLRIAWNLVSVVDPAFTIPILLLVLTGMRLKKRSLARIALCWAVLYPLLGMLQRDRAEAIGYELARSRGEEPIRLEAKPSFCNLLVWKIVYETPNRYHVDAVRVGWGNSSIFAGSSVEKVNRATQFPWLATESQQFIDVDRFRWFSNGYIARDPDYPNRIIDVRYSMIPNDIDALWGIELDPDATATEHVGWVTDRTGAGEKGSVLLQMILDQN